MNSLGINLADYQSQDLNNQILYGNGETTQEKISELAKALEAEGVTGMQVVDSQTDSGAALKLESLDKVLKVLDFKEQEISIWKKIPKFAAYNTVEEYDQLQSYGNDVGGFYQEGELPNEEDTVYVRRAQVVKFIGVTKAVTHPLSLVKTITGNVLEREVKNGMMWVLRTLNRGLWQADSTIVPEQFNGLFSQQQNYDQFASLNDYMTSENVVDLRGDYLKEKYIESAQEGIVNNHGIGTELFAGAKVLSDFVKNFYGNKFINPNTPQVSAGMMGQRVVGFDSQFGRIGLNYDFFLGQNPYKYVSSSSDQASAPNAPSAGSVTPVASYSQSMWGSDAGAYYYMVTALNRFGESAPLLLNGSTATVVAGGAFDLSWTAPTTGPVVTGYNIYRSLKGASNSTGKFYPCFKVSASQFSTGYDGASAGTVRDNDRFMPNTYQAFLIENNADVVLYKQLAPILKMDLALVSPAFRFMVLQYGTPILSAPKKMTRLINIGVAS